MLLDKIPDVRKIHAPGVGGDVLKVNLSLFDKTRRIKLHELAGMELPAYLWTKQKILTAMAARLQVDAETNDNPKYLPASFATKTKAELEAYLWPTGHYTKRGSEKWSIHFLTTNPPTPQKRGYPLH